MKTKIEVPSEHSFNLFESKMPNTPKFNLRPLFSDNTTLCNNLLSSSSYLESKNRHMSFDQIESASKELTCGHKDRKHFAKGLCKNCYTTSIRKSNSKKASECPHTDRPHYSSGLCVNCYHKK